jgi:type I restriction enzyme M protein
MIFQLKFWSCFLHYGFYRTQTYFGYYKDDGFVKRKVQGRIDVYGKWEAIKEKWITNYINRKTEAGLSANRVVTAQDEWCAEAYMETDYSKISEIDFIREIKKYVAFKVLNQ